MTKTLSTIMACKVAGLDRQRFNEAVSAGFYSCAPETVPGKSRKFAPDDVIGLRLYRELLDDGHTKQRAGQVACAVAIAAKFNPSSKAISYVEDYFFAGGTAYPAEQVPPPEMWDQEGGFLGGTDIRSVMTFNVAKIRKLIDHYIETEASHLGDD